MEVLLKLKGHYVRNHINRIACVDVIGRISILASQSKLGVCSQRRAQPAAPHFNHFAIVGQTLNPKNMNTQTLSNGIAKLVEDAHSLVNATVEVSEEKIGQARQHLLSSLDRSREIFQRLRAKEQEATGVMDTAMHENAFKAVGVAIGLGAFLGYLLARRCASTHCQK